MTLTETLQKEDLGWVLTLANSSNQRDKELLLAKVNVLVAHTVRTTVEQIEMEVREEKKEHWHLQRECVDDPDEGRRREAYNTEVGNYINGALDLALNIITKYKV